jgi:hypothetical protein
MSLTSAITTAQLQALLAIIRLGDVDRLGWWRSHSVDETAEYILGQAFPHTWMASGLELAMESARIRHDAALDRPSAIHLFSDYLPFHRQLRSWLVERKLEKDTAPLVWLRNLSTEDLKAKVGGDVDAQRRGGGLYLGDVQTEQLEDGDGLDDLLSRLARAYARLDAEFLAPYLDLVT